MVETITNQVQKNGFNFSVVHLYFLFPFLYF